VRARTGDDSTSVRPLGRAAAAPPAQLLDTLELGVMVLSRDLHIAYANARWSAWLSEPVIAGSSMSAFLCGAGEQAEAELRAVLLDGRHRTVMLTLCGARAVLRARGLVAHAGHHRAAHRGGGQLS
jgi:hypothetical protein